MKTISLVSILLSAVFSNQTPTPDGRIVGGYEVKPKFMYPWMVSLQYNGRHSCGGSLYTDNAVISAAHCVIGTASSWTALVHRHNLMVDAASENGVTYKILSRISHPDYGKNYNGNDVSVWKLDVKNPNVAPKIKFDTGKFATTDNTLLKVIGWGTTASSGSVSSVLKEVVVPVFNATKCKKAYPDLDTATQFCAGYPEGGKDSCQGDSGGPMFIKVNNEYYHTGVVSWGRSCALKGYPGVYTSIYAVSDFITKTVKTF